MIGLEEVLDWSKIEDDGVPFEALDCTVVSRFMSKDHSWMLYKDGLLVGWFGLSRNLVEGKFHSWRSGSYIYPEFRGQGIAKWIRINVARAFKELDVPVYSRVSLSNEKSLSLTYKLFPGCRKENIIEDGTEFALFDVTSAIIEWQPPESVVYDSVLNVLKEYERDTENGFDLGEPAASTSCAYV